MRHYLGTESNRDTYAASGAGRCPPGNLVGQGIIYTTAAECRILQGSMFGTYKDWESIGCILDFCRIGKGIYAQCVTHFSLVSEINLRYISHKIHLPHRNLKKKLPAFCLFQCRFLLSGQIARKVSSERSTVEQYQPPSVEELAKDGTGRVPTDTLISTRNSSLKAVSLMLKITAGRSNMESTVSYSVFN